VKKTGQRQGSPSGKQPANLWCFHYTIGGPALSSGGLDLPWPSMVQ